MKRIEDLLREEFRRNVGAPALTRDAMLAGVTKVRRGRTAGDLLATVVVAASALAAAAVLGGQPRSAVGGSPPRPLYTAKLINILFTDHDHGLALQEYCSMLLPGDPEGGMPSDGPTPDVHQQCIAQLPVTTDAGRTWGLRELPAPPATKDAGVHLQSGHSLMLWVDGPGTVAVGGWDRRYWTTADDGQTWHESATPRETGPPGSLAGFGPDDQPTFLASYPAGGPDAVGDKNPLVTATDGSFWVACQGGACVQVTRDHGQTWQILPAGETTASINWVATADGRTVYAAIQDATASRLLRSADGGATWTDVPGLSVLPWRSAAGLALANGDLIMTSAAESGGTYRLRAGASTLELLASAPAHPGALYRTAGWVVAAPARDQRGEPDLASLASISPDNGTNWLTVPPPTA